MSGGLLPGQVPAAGDAQFVLVFENLEVKGLDGHEERPSEKEQFKIH
jgi:hypothetical protein